MTAGGPAARRETFFSASRLVAPTLLAGGSSSRGLALQQRAHRQSFDARRVMRVGMGIDNHASDPSIVALEGLSTAVVAPGRLEEAHYFREWLEWMIQGREGRDNSV
jgi:hypothetical protein